MEIVAIANQKGGVGKTTIATNIAAVMSKDKKVLLIDHDVSHASLNFHHRRSYLEDVSSFEISAPRDVGEMLENLKKKCFDIIIIDVGGYGDDMARAALIFADLILIPTSVSTQDMDGNMHFMNLLKKLEKAGACTNIKCIANNVHPQMAKARIKKELEYFSYEVIGVMPRYASLDVSHALGKSIAEHLPASKEAIAISKLVKNIEELINGNQ